MYVCILYFWRFCLYCQYSVSPSQFKHGAAPCPFSLASCPFPQHNAPFLKLHKMAYILVKKIIRIWQKLRKFHFFQFEAWSCKEDTCCYNILFSVNPFTTVTNYLRQFWHITLMTIPQLAKFFLLKMKCEFEPLNNFKVQVKLSKQILYRKAAWLKTKGVILVIKEKKMIPIIMWFW